MDNAKLRGLVTVGEHTLISKFITLAATVVVVWDHLLTLPDEVKYVWKTKRSWTFWLFITSRYSILLYKTWNMTSTFWPGYTQEVSIFSLAVLKPVSHSFVRRLKLEGYYFVFIITLGQIFLTARVYALTKASKYVLFVFGILVASSLATGVWLVSVPSATAMKLPEINLDSFRTCIFSASVTAEWAYRAQVAFADLVTLICIVVFVLKLKANNGQSRMTRLMRTILQDGVLYFFVMAAFHIAMVFCTFFTGSYAPIFPPITIIVLIPVMISRLVISLRKAVDGSLVMAWDEDHFTTVEGHADGPPLPPMSFASVPFKPPSFNQDSGRFSHPHAAGHRSAV